MFELVIIIGGQMVQPTYEARYHATLDLCSDAGVREMKRRIHLHKVGLGYNCNYVRRKNQ